MSAHPTPSNKVSSPDEAAQQIRDNREPDNSILQNDKNIYGKNPLAGVSEDVGEWPEDIVLVRHGQSEGNLAKARTKNGDYKDYTPAFQSKHSSKYRLTPLGAQQAKAAGKWIQENILDSGADVKYHKWGAFDRYYTSEYIRAMETAALLGLKGAAWTTELLLRERDKGHFDNLTWLERNRFVHDIELRKRDSFFWAPPSGESMAQVCVRVDHVLNTVRRGTTPNKKVIIVGHGETMWSFRARLERLSFMDFHKLHDTDTIFTGSVLHYTRISPTTGEVFPYYRFMRLVCPWKSELSWPSWKEINLPVYTNEELLAIVNKVPLLIENRANEDEGAGGDD